MAIYQAFIKLLDGRSQCLQFPTPIITGQTLIQDLSSRTKIPADSIRLVSGRREITAGTLIPAAGDGLFPSLTLLVRLRGGKGGFGSLLRGAATKAGQKKTNNFDACRDMSGRRLRHVNAEKRIEEWRGEAEERKLERLAEEFLKKKAKERKKDKEDVAEKYLEKYREDSGRCMGEVEESVRRSFGLYKEGKRKVVPGAAGEGSSAKKLKIWLGKKKMEESDSDEDDSESEDEDEQRGGSGSGTEDDRSAVLDGGNCSTENEVLGEGSPASGSCGSLDGGELSGVSVSSAGEQLGEVNEDATANCPVEQGFVSGDGTCESDDTTESEKGLPRVAPNGESPSEDMAVIVEPVTIEEVHAQPNVAEKGIESGAPPVEHMAVLTELVTKEEMHVQPTVAEKGVESASEVVTAAEVNTIMEEPFNFDKYNSAAELEILGLEHLKVELQSHGLKCGGTLQERASRLFLLKTTPVDKLPKKLLAKPSGTK